MTYKKPTLPQIFPVTSHTNFVGPGSTFVAIKGENTDGVNFIIEALDKGATTIITKNDTYLPSTILQEITKRNSALLRVPCPRKSLAQLSAAAANNPAQQLNIIGITGTKGKTTSAYIIEHILQTAGHKTALISTVTNRIGNHNIPTHLTTDQPDYLHQFLKLCVQQNVDYVIMEVAAQALSLHRVHTIKFDGIIFTNFSQEHGEFYDSLDEYFAAKRSLLLHAKKNTPIVLNCDDDRIAKILTPNHVTVSLRDKSATFFATHENKPQVTVSTFIDDTEYLFSCPTLIGTYNAYNILGAIALTTQLNVSPAVIQNALQTLPAIPGRMQKHVLPNGATCIIDYAHNPSSYESLLSTLRTLTDHLIVVFGCGGQREKARRPKMGAIAAHYANIIVLTNDNPRNEDPQKIISAIRQGIKNEKTIVHEILDRKAAIEKACALTHPSTIVAVLGKGPDEYQIIGSKKTFFSDTQIIKKLQKSL